MDGMKHSNDHIFLNAFAHEDRKLEKERAIYYIMYDETSLGERRKRHGGLQTDLVEHMHVVTPSPLKLPVAQRKLSATSTNQSNHIGPLVTDSRPEHVWSVSFYEKKIKYYAMPECQLVEPHLEHPTLRIKSGGLMLL